MMTKVYAVFAWLSALLAILVGLAIFTGGELATSLDTATDNTFSSLGRTAAIVLLVIAFVETLVGIGLWTHQSWSRVGIIIICALNLLNFPLGTLIGLFGIYLFGFNNDVRELFTDRTTVRRARAVAARRR
jgi:hypothetical protein